MTFNITQEYISKGKRNDASQCAIAMRICEGGFGWVEVTEMCIQVDGATYYNDPGLSEWINKIDCHIPVGPITIELLGTQDDNGDEHDLQACIVGDA